MFQEVLSINKNYAIVKISNNIFDDIINSYVVFEENDKRILGEVEAIDGNKATITFIGEFVFNKYYSGLVRRPSLNANVRMINQHELEELVGDNDEKTMVIGNTVLYNSYPVKISIDEFFGSHMIMLGSSGVGKTSAAIRIIQNLFSLKDFIPFNSNIFIFNKSREYEASLRDINKVNPNYNFKMYTTNKENENDSLIKLPICLLNENDFIDILNADSYFQSNLVRKMLDTVYIFASNNRDCIKYKNHLIASAIFSIMYSNQLPLKIRDQIFKLLTQYHTKELNLDADVPGIGYTRDLKKCFEIDSNGEFVEKAIINKYIQSFIDNDYEWKVDRNNSFSFDDLEVALNFALINENIFIDGNMYNEALLLKDKLHSINVKYRSLFDEKSKITLDQYIRSLLLIDDNRRVQIVNFVFDNIDNNIERCFVKIISRLLFDYSKNLKQIYSMPMVIMLDNANEYINNDLNYDNIFYKILKDGNKYGVNLNLIIQEPRKVSETVYAYCENYIMFKINNQNDLDYLKNIIPIICDKIDTLQIGNSIVFGKMMRVPFIIKFKAPNKVAKHYNSSIYDKWMIQWNDDK